MFTGCITALITPFKEEELNLDGMRENIRFQLQTGVQGILVCGSTGESPCLNETEWEMVIQTAVAEAKGKIPVIAGAGTNSTWKSVRQIRRAEELGVDAVLVVAPYYNKPTQEGLYQHFRACAEATRLPLIIYNIPPRSVVNIQPATIERLVNDCPNIVAVKEASGNLDQVSDILIRCGDRITVLSGDDSLTLPILSLGGRGVISVVSNIVPDDVQALVDDYLEGKTESARKRHLKLFPLIKALFLETNPIPVKAAMNMLGMPAGYPRLPLSPLSSSSKALLRQALQNYGLRIKHD
ncbi:MAG: 4-hydroxy-tetrahydrodipicolinate synthase [candidate division WOR-3 bacterium]